MVNSKEFSNRLEQIFDYYDLNASAFADKIDVGRASISHLLSGRNKPSLDFVMRVVKTFPEVELYWLLNGKGDFPQIDEETQDRSRSSLRPQNQNSEEVEEHPEKPPIVRKQQTPKDIERIVIFYKNGSFSTYTPN
ncbi:helix-turn-helix transcriptional regulator [Mesohalobacter halotolerans]|jgi:plasmid maintenance system antidote protein VapI|uniref:Helix-turn-helix transcriptional regulator n=1 Tax=Mesohalobacter halotolerans TaxID=1883405 RepID=A0A4U5TQQ6_9FLAO|nr:helix-turn-helix transcriptional regulator [Mesohalobacter halotolerans]MBS3737764.1 helix-turn-helix transcriptional regulator [Psychroflexus sp.]NBC56779.1 helix-turn-helix domain-containing protein [Bacteroidota bacterium]TKS56539.1 helix-turn-helix transcriptional regulator [Mesohalobacter halotolerans]